MGVRKERRMPNEHTEHDVVFAQGCLPLCLRMQEVRDLPAQSLTFRPTATDQPLHGRKVQRELPRWGTSESLMRTWVRCRKCEARRVLNRHPDNYLRPPKCRSCGHTAYRVVTNYPRPLCGCSGYHFIHRKGSLLCEHHPEGFANRVRRMKGATKDDILDALLDCPGKVSIECPF